MTFEFMSERGNLWLDNWRWQEWTTPELYGKWQMTKFSNSGFLHQTSFLEDPVGLATSQSFVTGWVTINIWLGSDAVHSFLHHATSWKERCSTSRMETTKNLHVDSVRCWRLMSFTHRLHERIRVTTTRSQTMRSECPQWTTRRGLILRSKSRGRIWLLRVVGSIDWQTL